MEELLKWIDAVSANDIPLRQFFPASSFGKGSGWLNIK